MMTRIVFVLVTLGKVTQIEIMLICGVAQGNQGKYSTDCT